MLSAHKKIKVVSSTADSTKEMNVWSTSSKLKIYKSLIRRIVTYGGEAWTLTNRDENYLRKFERRILRKIYGPVQN
jgi:hypothetical protein